MRWDIPAENPEGRAFIAVVIVFYVLAVLAFALRFYSRRLHENALDASDYTCLLGVILNAGLVVLLWLDFASGWGQQPQDFTLADARFASKSFVAIDIIWNAATNSVRASMLLLYIRLFTVPVFRATCWVFLGLMVAELLTVILSVFLICRPIAYSFNRTIPNGHCGDLTKFDLYTAIFNLVADFIVVALPMPMLWRLQMKTKRKIGISFIFSMGLCICALTLTRVLASVYYDQDDYTKQAALIALITGLEPIIGAINACLPFMPLVLKRIGETRILRHLRTRYGSSSGGGKGDLATSSMMRSRQSRKFKELPEPDGLSRQELAHLPPDLEMNPFSNAGLGKAYAGHESEDSLADSGLWDGMADGVPQILVRKDFSIESRAP